jgi:tetratricopeptide (TPR) repeat protein
MQRILAAANSRTNIRRAASSGCRTWLAQQKVLGSENRSTLATLSSYFQAMADQGKLQEAERLAHQCLETCERVFGPDDRDTIQAHENMAYVLATGGNFAEAERYEREALKGYEHIGLADAFDAGYAVNNIAIFRFLQGDAEEAERLLLSARSRAVNNFGPEHAITLHIQHVLVRVLAEEGKLDEAEALAKETLVVRLRVMPRGHEGTGRTLLYLGKVLVEKGKPDEAEPFLKEALTLFRQYYGKKPELAAQVENWLGAIQLARHAYPEAEALLLAGPDHLLAPTATLSPKERRTAIDHIIKLYQQWGKPEQAATWQKKLDEAAKPHVGRK